MRIIVGLVCVLAVGGISSSATRAAEISVTEPVLVANEADTCGAALTISGTLTGATRLTYSLNSSSASEASVMAGTWNFTAAVVQGESNSLTLTASDAASPCPLGLDAECGVGETCVGTTCFADVVSMSITLNGISCDDGNACTQNDCAADGLTCDAPINVVPEPNICDDGDACTVNDSCDNAGTCEGGGPAETCASLPALGTFGLLGVIAAVTAAGVLLRRR